MSAEPLHVHYNVDGGNFTSAGEASVKVKRLLRQLGCSPETIRRVSIAMYKREITVVIHSSVGYADIVMYDPTIRIVLKHTGPGIKDVDQAMQECYSTAPDNIRALGFGAGMGLPNMKRYSDTFHIDSVVGQGTTIELGFENK